MSSGLPKKSPLVPSMEEADAFVDAAGRGDMKALDNFLDEYPSSSNAVNSSGITALAMAATKGQKDAITFLLSKGAWIDKRDGNGKTALMLAVLGGQLVAAETLLGGGANIDAKDHSGWTILMQAAHAGEAGPTRFLLEKGAATDWVDENDMTAEMIARWSGHKDIAELIDGWSILPVSEEEKRARDDAPARDLSADRLEKLKNRRPPGHPLKKKGPQP